MQKKLIALAVAGLASSAAFADNVSMYGVIDAAYVNAGGSGLRSGSTVVAGGLAASRVGFNVSEDLGNGTKVIANLEYQINNETTAGVGAANGSIGSGIAARQQLLGLTGSWGTFATGYLQTAAYDFGAKYDVAAGAAVSASQAMVNGTAGGTAKRLIGTTGAAARANSALAYISPNMSGFTIAVNHAILASSLSANTSADPGVTATLVAANYENGPLSVGAVWAQAKLATAVSSTTKNTEWALGASYNFGVATVKAAYQAGHTDTPGIAGNTDKVWSLGGVIPAGPGAVLVSYAKAKLASTAADDDGSAYTLGYLYPMSKRTTAYVAYERATNASAGANFGVDNGVIGPVTAGGSAHMIALGLNHKF